MCPQQTGARGGRPDYGAIARTYTGAVEHIEEDAATYRNVDTARARRNIVVATSIVLRDSFGQTLDRVSVTLAVQNYPTEIEAVCCRRPPSRSQLPFQPMRISPTFTQQTQQYASRFWSVLENRCTRSKGPAVSRFRCHRMRGNTSIDEFFFAPYAVRPTGAKLSSTDLPADALAVSVLNRDCPSSRAGCKSDICGSISRQRVSASNNMF